LYESLNLDWPLMFTIHMLTDVISKEMLLLNISGLSRSKLS
jgi:hypothetical protein